MKKKKASKYKDKISSKASLKEHKRQNPMARDEINEAFRDEDDEEDDDEEEDDE